MSSIKTLYEYDILKIIEKGKVDSNDLLYLANKNFEKRFNKICKDLNKLIKDVQKHFPDANYYLANDILNLMLGRTHSNNYEQQSELSALGILIHTASGGDW